MVSPSVWHIGAAKRTYTPATFVPMKTAPRVEAMFLDMTLRSERGKQMEEKGGVRQSGSHQVPGRVPFIYVGPRRVSRNARKIEQEAYDRGFCKRRLWISKTNNEYQRFGA